MKRSQLGAGTKSLQRGSTFKAPSGPAKHPRPRRPSTVSDKVRSEAWARHARSKSCAVCGSEIVEGHHVITKQQLRRVARADGLEVDRILWDLRNCLSLCEGHHAAHHSWARRLTLTFVIGHCPKLDQFARELGLDWWLERNYPGVGS